MKFDVGLRSAAQRLIDTGCVSHVRVLQNGRVVTGIAGADRVYIRCRSIGGQDRESAAIDGECSCGGRPPCVHVAAVLIAAAGALGASPRNSQQPTRAPTRNAAADQRLCYFVESRSTSDTAVEFQLSVQVAQIAADNRHIEPGACAFSLRTADRNGEYPRYVDAEDREILNLLAMRQVDAPWRLQGAVGFGLLTRIVATGRALWHAPHGPALRPGDARHLALAWQTLPNGDQRLQCATASSLNLILEVDPAVYIDTGSHECGRVELPCSSDLLRQFWNQPPIAPEQVATVSDEIARHPQAATLPIPRSLRLRRQALSGLSAKLVLSAGPEATLHFVYNGMEIDSRSLGTHPTVRRLVDDAVHEIERDRDGELALQAQLKQVLVAPPENSLAWLAFMTNGVTALQVKGWEISIDPTFPYRIVAADDWYADLRANARPEWFDLRLGVTVDGAPVNLLPALVTYLQAAAGTADPSALPARECLFTGEHLFVTLDDGRYLVVAVERIQRIANTLVELFDRDNLNERHALTLPSSHATRLAQLALEPLGPKLRSHDAWLLTLIDQLKDFSGISPMSAPANFRATLRPYQQEGLGWLQFLRRYRLGGILADDMGLGKTVQTLAHIATEKAQGRLIKASLIVAPVSVLGNWQQEIRRLTPELSLLILHGTRRKELFSAMDEADIVVTGYPQLHFDSEILLAREFYFLILDEAQMIKNPRVKVSQVARALRAEHRLCLTGTPMENHLGELWSLFDFLQPGLLGDERQFQCQYRTPIEKAGDTVRARALSRRIEPFLLRRTKDAVARELPRKMQIVKFIALDEKQRDFYDGIRLSMHRRVREAMQRQGVGRSHITLLHALLKLRQACCDPRLVNGDAQTRAIPSAKLDWLSTALPELIAEGRRILLFSQFTSMLRLIEAVVTELSIPYCLLTGKTRNRTPLIQRFQSGAVPLFLISLKAGGTGLNLTAADTVIHYDPWWNPAAETQATDRAHRIGQDKPVFVYKLIAEDTVEQKIMRLQAGKHALVSQLYSERNASPAHLSAADLEALFAP